MRSYLNVRREQIGAVVLLLIGLGVVVSSLVSFRIVNESRALGPAIMPVVAGGLLAVSSLLLLIRSTGEAATVSEEYSQAETDADTPPDDQIVSTARPVFASPVVKLLVIVVVVAVAIPIAGFAFALAAMVLAILALMEGVEIWRSIVISLSVGAGIWLVVHYLQIPTP